MTFSLEDQIKEVEREISMRTSVYKRQIENGKMSYDEATRRTDTMRAVLNTLYDTVKARDGIGDR